VLSGYPLKVITTWCTLTYETEKTIIQGPLHVHEPFRLVCEVLEKVDYYIRTVVAGKNVT